MRVRTWPKPSRALVALVLTLLVLTCLSALDGAVIAASVLAGAAALFAAIVLRGCAAAAGTVLRAVREVAAASDYAMLQPGQVPVAGAVAQNGVGATKPVDVTARLPSWNGAISPSHVSKYRSGSRREDVDST